MPNMSLMQIGKIISKERHNRGLTIEALSDITDISFQTLVGIENGKTNFKIETFLKIIDALQLSADYVLNITHNLSLDDEWRHLDERTKQLVLSIAKILTENEKNS